MKKFMFFIVLLSIANVSRAADTTAEIAINAVKSHEKIINFLADKSSHDFQVSYQPLKLGGICGFVGCNWRQLVSVIITSKSSNSPTKTILLLVEGITSSIDSKPKVSFISLESSLKNELIFIH
ncbi:MAG: hypothetical protein HRT53_04205 [Colwellia sp.]|nr:hypothetical protein [Colwellia sp.]